MKPHDPTRRRRGFVRRHPYFVLALALHVLVVGLLLARDGAALRRADEARVASRVEASLEQARRLQVQRSVQRLEDMQRRLQAATGAAPSDAGASGAGDAATPPLQRAQALADRIEQVEQAERAKALARLAKIAPAQALAKIRAEDAAARAKQPPLPSDPGDAAAQLEQRARHALERQAQRMALAEQGDPLTLAHAGGGQATGGQGRGQGNGSSQVGAGAHGRGGAGNADGGGHGAGNGVAHGVVDLDLAGGPLRAEAGFADPRNYTRPEDLPRITRASVHPGRGRVLGRGGEFADRVYLDPWYVAGPFEARGPRSLQQAYPPEWGVDLDAVYRGKGGELLHWVRADSPDYPFIPPDRAEDAIYYVWTELRVDRDTDVWLDIGADDDSKLWVDDTLVWASGDQDKAWYHEPFYRLSRELAAYDLVEGRRRVRLHAGRHTLLFKLYNGIDLMFLSVVVTP